MPINGSVRMAIGQVTHRKSKGKKFVAELNAALSPEAIASAKPETQPKNEQHK